jgi:hypothetical protein
MAFYHRPSNFAIAATKSRYRAIHRIVIGGTKPRRNIEEA